jgi:uncharacterized metal-binding protein YceD (DUF177 family)
MKLTETAGQEPPKNEFSRVVSMSKVFSNQGTVHFSGTPEECSDLAKRFDLASIKNLDVTFYIHVGRTHKGGFFVTGTLASSVVQRCIVTLKDVPETIAESFELHVLDERYNTEQSLEDLGDDDVEFMIKDEVDLGEVAAQYLSLSLNPYPRYVEETSS